jgi:hypothetical protein
VGVAEDYEFLKIHLSQNSKKIYEKAGAHAIMESESLLNDSRI